MRGASRSRGGRPSDPHGVDPDKPCAERGEGGGAMVIPDKKLTEKVVAGAGNEVVPVSSSDWAGDRLGRTQTVGSCDDPRMVQPLPDDGSVTRCSASFQRAQVHRSDLRAISSLLARLASAHCPATYPGTTAFHGHNRCLSPAGFSASPYCLAYRRSDGPLRRGRRE